MDKIRQINWNKRTPFKGFQRMVVLIILLSILWHHNINDYIRNTLGRNYKINRPVRRFIALSFYLAPLLLMMYYDVHYGSFSMRKIGILRGYNKQFNFLIRVIGAYGVLLITMKDLDIDIGHNQEALVKMPVSQFILAFCAANSITQNRSESLIGTLMFYIIKYPLSHRTKPKVVEKQEHKMRLRRHYMMEEEASLLKELEEDKLFDEMLEETV